MTRRRIAAAAAGLALALLSGCGAAPRPETLELFAMDTYMSLSAYGDGANRALTEAGQTINELDSRLSRTRPDSDIGRLNLYGSAEIDPDTAALLERSADYVRKTG